MHYEPFDKGLVYGICVFMIPLYSVCVMRWVGFSGAKLSWYRGVICAVAAGLSIFALTNPWHGEFALFEVALPGEPNHMLDYQQPGIGLYLTEIYSSLVVAGTALIGGLRIARSHFSGSSLVLAVLMPLIALDSMLSSAVTNILLQYEINPFVLLTTIVLYYFSFWPTSKSSRSVLPITHTKLLELMPDAVVNLDDGGKVVDCNAAFEQIVGRTTADAINKPLHSMLPQMDFLADETIRQHTMTLSQDGSARHYDLRIRPLDSDGSSTSSKVIMFRDITERVLAYLDLQNSERRLHAANNELLRLSTTDSLTGLRNRRYFLEHVEQEMERLARNGEFFGVLSLDIDHFKSINDTHGHPVGDFVLTQVARALEAECRAEDTLARTGGEEFMVLLTQCDQMGLTVAAERFRLGVQNLDLCLDDGSTLNVTVSVGATLSQTSDTMRELFFRVDQQLYLAKRRGRNLSVASA